jgi:uncharacterized protein (TIGR02996 family)
MSGYEGFLRAIVESPEDDLPRLIFADWLEGRGKADRAAFIRTQCALARCGEEGDERDALEAAGRRLARKGYLTWAPDLVREKAAAWEFERGFVSAIKIKAADLLEAGKGLRAVAPIRRVDLAELGDVRLADLAVSGVLAGLASLDLGRICPDDLRMTGDHWADELATALAGAGIGELELGESVALPILRAWKREVAPLPRIVVGRAQYSWSTAILDLSLMEDRHQVRWARCRAISLGRFFGTDLCARLDGLEGLWLENAPASGPWRPYPGATEDLPGGRSARPLRELTLRYCYFQPGDLQNLFEATRLAGLSRLDLHGQHGMDDWSELFRGEPHPALRSLTIRHGGAARGLASPSHLGWERFPNLGHLAVEDASTPGDGDALLRSLAGSVLGPRLRKLRLRWKQVTAAGIDALAGAGVLERLHVLELMGGGLQDELAERLIAIGPWPALALLDLRYTSFSHRLRRRLREAFGVLAEVEPGDRVRP